MKKCQGRIEKGMVAKLQRLQREGYKSIGKGRIVRGCERGGRERTGRWEM